MITFHSITGTSPAAAGGAVLGGVAPSVAGFQTADLARYEGFHAIAYLVGATGGTLDVLLETSSDGGTTWQEYGRWAQLAAGAAAVVKRSSANMFDNNARTIGSTTSAAASTFVMTGDAGFAGHWGDRMRVRCVAGAGTTAGASLRIDLVFTYPDG